MKIREAACEVEEYQSTQCSHNPIHLRIYGMDSIRAFPLHAIKCKDFIYQVNSSQTTEGVPMLGF